MDPSNLLQQFDDVCTSLQQGKLKWKCSMMVKPMHKHPAFVYELSNLDVSYPKGYSVSGILYFDGQQKESHIEGDGNPAELIHKALRELLDHYPWLAGRLSSNLNTCRGEVVCENQGVHFVSAYADFKLCDLGDFTQPSPHLDFLQALHPDHPPCIKPSTHDMPLVALQVTTFTCGSFVLSITNKHTVMDGVGTGTFIKNLCSIARGDGIAIPIDNTDRLSLQLPSLPSNISNVFLHSTIDIHQKANLAKSIIVTPTKYNFRLDVLDYLRKDILRDNECKVSHCSRYHTLVALLWKAKAKAYRNVPTECKLGVRMLMCVRERIIHSLPKGYLGNAFIFIKAIATIKDLCQNSLAFALTKIVNAVSNRETHAMQSAREPSQIQPNILEFAVPSIVGLGFYDANCGWGKPVYFGRQSKQRTSTMPVLEGSRLQPSSWDVLIPFESEEERLSFEEVIKSYIDTK